MIPVFACVSNQLEISTHKFDGLHADKAPYLVLTKSGCDCEHSDYPTFLNITDGIIYHCNIPSLAEKLFVGAHHGWLGLVDKFCEPTIVNPTTGQEISLPSITTLPNIFPSYNSDGSLCCYSVYDNYYKLFHIYMPKQLCRSNPFTKLIFSANPSSSTDFIVAAIHMLDYNLDLIFTKPNESKWNTFEFREGFVDLTFRDEKTILAMTLYGSIHLMTLDEKCITTEEISGPLVDANRGELRYLVDDRANGILQVVRDLKFTTHPTTRSMTVLRLVVDDQGDKKWIVVKSLDGQAIFVGAGATTLLPKNKVCGEIKPDSVYFTDDWWDLFQKSRKLDRDIGRYNVKDGSLEFFSRKFYHVTWPPPIWMH